MSQLFVPGFGAVPGLYRRALPADWLIHEPPSFRNGPTFEARLAALLAALDRCGSSVTLAGHSMGAALAVAAALDRPERIERLLLIAPAGLPLEKPIGASLREFAGQVAARVYAPRELVRSVASAFAAPLATLRLARAVRALDLRHELAEVRRWGISCEVVGCAGDTLTPVDHCRQIAVLCGARYRELDAAGGHMWMVIEPAAFAGLRYT